MFLIAYGTRPEYIKVKPIIDEMLIRNIPFETLFTGQHVNLIQDTNPDITMYIPESDNRLNTIISSCMNLLNINILHPYKYVLVQGDTTSALGVAIAAFHSGIKVIHLEAGLRTYDIQNPYPEEANRRMISQIASIHLCPNTLNELNLYYERIKTDVYNVGNTVIDNLVKYKDMCEYGNSILITLHRRENHHQMDEWFKEINRLAIKYNDLKFIIPLHPNPNVQKHKHILKDVTIINPMEYDDFIQELIKCRLVITDSGGIQEECSYFNKKCLVCRTTTERPEVVGLSSFLVRSPSELYDIFSKHINEYVIDIKNTPYGVGDSAIRIVNILSKL